MEKNILEIIIAVFFGALVMLIFSGGGQNFGSLSRTWNTPSTGGTFGSSTVNFQIDSDGNAVNLIIDSVARNVTVICVPGEKDPVYLYPSDTTTSAEIIEGILVEPNECFVFQPPGFAWRGDIWARASSTTSTVSYYYK